MSQSRNPVCLVCFFLLAIITVGGVWVEVDIVGEQTHTKTVNPIAVVTASLAGKGDCQWEEETTTPTTYCKSNNQCSLNAATATRLKIIFRREWYNVLHQEVTFLSSLFHYTMYQVHIFIRV